MAEKHVILGGGNLTLDDILKLHDGASVVIDAEVRKDLAQVGEEVQFDLSAAEQSDSKIRPALAVCLNKLLRGESKARLNVVDFIAECLNGKNPFTDLESLANAVSMNEVEKELFIQPNVFPTYKTALAMAQLKKLLPIFDFIVAFLTEINGVNWKIYSETNFHHISNGIKQSLSSVESLLLDSKQARKATDVQLYLDLVQSLGNLRDVLDENFKSVEREMNALGFTAANVKVDRSLLSVKRIGVNLWVVLEEISTKLQHFAQNLEVPSTHLPEAPLSNFSTFEGIAAFTDFLVNAAENLAGLSEQLFKACLKNLDEKEAALNASGGKPRSLPIGKGTRQIRINLAKSPQVFDNRSDLLAFLDEFLLSQNDTRRVPKLAKGMRDFSPEQMAIREIVFETIKRVFKRHMAGELETPVLELRETLTGKYGEEGSKLIYNLADQGGEMLSLRYDLTVPFARYVAMNRLLKWKRFQIGKVYRRDQPQIKRGRFREFYQCDYDVVGAGATMVQDAEVLKIVVEILSELNLAFSLKINHRKLLDALLIIAGCPESKFRTISSSIDKLDKEEWSKVRQEIVVEKGLSEQSADIIGEFVRIHGTPSEIVAQLRSDLRIQQSELAMTALSEMDQLISYLECFEIIPSISFDLSLARGLDYYTGLVYEAVLTDNTQGVGSIAGGGRYDQLIGKLNNSGSVIPAVGVSFGVERMFAILEERYKDRKMIYPKNAVLVAQAGNSNKYKLMNERWRICSLLWSKGIPAETSYKEKPNPKEQVGYASENAIPWVVWVGESELDTGSVRLKHLASHEEQTMNVNELAQYILNNSS
jgi:histidyl-tRNA synthetase